MINTSESGVEEGAKRKSSLEEFQSQFKFSAENAQFSTFFLSNLNSLFVTSQLCPNLHVYTWALRIDRRKNPEIRDQRSNYEVQRSRTLAAITGDGPVVSSRCPIMADHAYFVHRGE